MPQYGTGLLGAGQASTTPPTQESPSDLTIEQKNEIASFASINPELSVDMIRENYAEKFKKIITPDMLSKIMKRGTKLKTSKHIYGLCKKLACST